MLRKIPLLFIVCLMIINFCGCASIPGSTTAAPKELKLKWNISYVQGLVLVKGALKTEKLQFENAIITQDTAKLKGNYADGRTVQIIISKINNSESSVKVNVAGSQVPREDERKILEMIMQYSKRGQ